MDSNKYSVKVGIKLADNAIANVQKDLNEKLKNEKFEVSFSSKGLDDISKKLDEISTKLGNVSKSDGFNKTSSTAKKAAKEVDNLNNKMEKTGKHLKNQAFATDNWAYNWSKAMQSFLTYNTVTQFFNTVSNGIQDMILEVKELDDALTELKKVTDLEGDSLDKFVDKAFETGREVAKTGTEMVGAATSFAKAGYDEESILELGKVAAMYTNIADEEISAADSADFIIAQLKAFNLESEDINKTLENSYHIIDAVNEVSNNYAVSSADIATNMGKASVVMANAGNSMEQMIGLMTAGTEITRNASKVANGLKTITLRLQGMDDEGQESLELQAQMEALFQKLGISVYDANGELKNTYEILETLAPVYQKLTNAEKAYVTETIAGKYQAQNAAAILKNWGTAVDATTTALNSNGSAARENVAVLDSIQGHLQNLQSAWSELSNSIFNSDLIKYIIDLGTGLLKVANSDAVKFIAQFLLINKVTKLSISGFQKFMRTMLSSSQNVSKLATSLAYLTKGESGLGEYLYNNISGYKNLTAAQKRSIVSDYAKVASQTAVNLAIGASTLLITGAISIYQKYKQEQKEMIDNAVESGEELNSWNQELDDSIKSIEDYKKILSDNTSSEEDVTSAKEALIEIQDKLVERYGDEAKGIDLVNGKIDDQIEKIKELKREDAQKWLNENQKAIDKAQNKKNSKVDKDGLYYSGELMTNWGSGSWKKTDFMADWGKKQGYDVRAENGLGNGILYSDMGDEETLEYLNKLSEYLQKNKQDALDAGLSEKQYQEMLNSVGAEIKKIKEDYESYNTILNEYKQNILSAAEGYSDFNKEAEKKGKQGELGTDELDALLKKYPDVKKAMEESGQTSEEMIEKYNDSSKAVEKFMETYANDKPIQDYIDAIRKGQDYMTDDEGMKKIISAFNDYGISIDDVIEHLNNLQNAQKSTDEEILQSADDIEKSYSSAMDNITENYERLTSAIDEYNESGYLSSETLSKLINNDLLQYLSYENGQLVANTSELYNNAEAQRISASQKLYQAMASDVMAVAEGNVQEASELAQSAVANLGNNAETAANQAANGVGKFLSFADAVDKTNKVLSGKELTADTKKNIKAVQDAYKPYFDLLSKPVNIEKKKYTGSGSGSKSGSGSGSKSGSGSSSKSEKEWWEKEYDALKDQFDYSEITIEQYIGGLENLLGRLDKGSEAWKKINKELQKQRLDKVKDDYDAGRISLDQYIISLQNLQQAYKAGTDAWNDLADAIKKAKLDKLKEQQDDLKSALSAVNNTLDKQIDKYEEAKEAADKKYDDEIDKLEELQDKLDDQNDDYERAQQAVADYLDEQMSAIEKQRDTVETYYDNVLNAIEKMNEKQQESLELAEAYEALMNAMTQKTKKVKYMLSIKIAQNGETPEKDNPVGKIYFKYIIMKGVELWLVVKDTLSKNLKINY